MSDFVTEQVQQLMSWVVPDVYECRRTAMELVARAPGASREQLARELVRAAQKRAATVGGVTGLAAGPFSMVPAALADMAATLKIEGTMVGGVAALLDPDSLEDPERFKADVLAVVFPAAVSQALRQLGMRAGEQITKTVVRRAAGKGSLETLVRVAGRMLGAKLTGRTVVTKGLPLVGIGIGAGWNWVEASAVGHRAIAYHTGQPVAEQKLRALGQKLTPAKWRGRLWGPSGGGAEGDGSPPISRGAER
jgi:hypothetical protein